VSGRNFLDGRVTLLAGDCLEILAALPEASVDSVVCDPPYGLQFMGREWDKLWRNGTEADVSYVERTKGELTSRARKLPDYSSSKPEQMQEFHEAWARLVLRVLRPGGHLVAFSGTRTYHRMACAIEDAGFEIRDQIGWAYGSGFPKSHDVSKGIDKAAGVEREVVGSKLGLPGYSNAATEPNNVYGDGFGNAAGSKVSDITAPATDAAKQWQGWGTALKPAWEPICLARKPLIGTVAANVLEHGVGALNIDGCRVETDESLNGGTYSGAEAKETSEGWRMANAKREFVQPPGRWPANLIHDGSEEVIEAFPEGRSAGDYPSDSKARNGVTNFTGEQGPLYADSGSAARFFYTAKADSTDRLGSKHPTVKPLDLMQWLVRLVTPKGGTVLDPFAGTGTTGEAAWREGCRAVLIEREAEYQADIARRMELAVNPTKRAAVAKSKNQLDNPGDLPLFAEIAE
jgi:DNA modification methylase